MIIAQRLEGFYYPTYREAAEGVLKHHPEEIALL